MAVGDDTLFLPQKMRSISLNFLVLGNDYNLNAIMLVILARCRLVNNLINSIASQALRGN